jgi:hypothetical protein
LGLLDPFSSFFLSFLFFAFLPFLPVIYFYKKKIVDLYVSKREKRMPFFLLTITSYSLATLIFYISGTKIMFLLALGYVCVTSILMIINLTWKISTHCAGVAGPISALFYVFGIRILPLFVLLAPLMWARQRLGAHTFAQSISGATVAVLVAIVEYTLLYS